MKGFVGYKKELLSVDELLKLTQELSTESSYYFLRWTDKVSGIIEILPAVNEFPMLEGQMFNCQCELRWKHKQKDNYEVLLLSIDHHENFEPIGKDWLIQEREAHLYPPTETRFPKQFDYPKNVTVKQRYFLDKETATINFIALTVNKKI